MLAGSNPGPGSRTMIRMPRCSSQATRHSTVLLGSSFAPCTTAFASASCRDSSIASSLPFTQFKSRTACMTCATTGSTELRSAARVTRTRNFSFCGSKSYSGKCSSGVSPASMVRSFVPWCFDSSGSHGIQQWLSKANPGLEHAASPPGGTLGRAATGRRRSILIPLIPQLQHPLLYLPPPIEFLDKPARIAPSRLGFDKKLQEQLRSQRALDLHARRGSDLLEHLAAFSHQDPLLPSAFAVDGGGDAGKPFALFEAVHQNRRGVGNLFAGVEQYLFANDLGGHESGRLIGDLIFRKICRTRRKRLHDLLQHRVQALALQRRNRDDFCEVMQCAVLPDQGQQLRFL